MKTMRWFVVMTMVLAASAFSQAGEDENTIRREIVESIKAMTVPEGFKVTLFAGEPNLMQPFGFSMDDRGKVEIDYRPVHMYTLSDDVEVVPPKARVY